MDFRKTEEQELLLESFREILTKECTENYLKECYREGVKPERVLEVFADNGFNHLGIPEEYGGTPVDHLTMMLLVEELARFGAPSYIWPQVIQVDDMLTFGNDEQKRVTLENAVQGKRTFCLMITEPEAGSDNTRLTTTATRKDGKVYLNGHKTFITGVKEAPYMLVVSRNLSNPKPREAMSMWWVPTNAPGVTIEPLHKIGWHYVSNCEVYLDNVEVDEKDLVGVENKGFMQLMKNFEIERLFMAAGCLGNAQAVFEDAARYANQREQFGKKIGAFQLTQEKLTSMAIKLENMRNMVYKCAWEKDNDIPVQISSAMTKMYCAQSAFEIADDAMQILGGIGYTEDHRISRLWRDLRTYRLAGGTDEIMVHIVGNGILKQYLR